MLKAFRVNPNNKGADAINILGEVLWHAATKDATIVPVSHSHMHEILGDAKRCLSVRSKAPVRFLEVAAYAHITGYLLAHSHGWNATLSDISVETLALGAKLAHENGLDTDRVRRVAVDFHDLPFPDGSFDIVYICSALHHTLRWQMVLKELLRVTVPGGILIMQNEPCHREFCFYKFPTNRPNAYRPVEAELERQGILRTIAEPYTGSRPETLFGMIENQMMSLPEILEVLGSQGSIERLLINSQVCMSSLDQAILAARRDPRKLATLSAMVETELLKRLDEAQRVFTEADIALGIRFPAQTEVTELAARVARRIEALPHRVTFAERVAYRMPALGALAARVARRLRVRAAPGASDYDIAVASIFGGAISAVVRKEDDGLVAPCPDDLRYAGGNRKGVIIGYPSDLASLLELACDLVPDIQIAAHEEIVRHFPEGEWTTGRDGDVRNLALSVPTASIRMRPVNVSGQFAVLLRIYGSPLEEPFRIRLLVDGAELAGFDVHQPESFLLRGELPKGNATAVLNIGVCKLNLAPLKTIPAVRILAVRVVCVASE